MKAYVDKILWGQSFKYVNFRRRYDNPADQIYHTDRQMLIVK